MAATTSRRALLGASLALPALVAPAVMAAPVGAVQQHGAGLTALQAKIANYARLYGEWEAFYDSRFGVMEDAHMDGQKAIAHLRTTRTYETVSGAHKSLSTEEWSLGAARRMLGDTPPHRDDYTAALSELIGLHEQRDRELEALATQLDVDAIEQRERELSFAYCTAADAVVNHLVTTHAELLAKLAFITDHDWWGMPGSEAGVKADMQRLAGEIA